MTIDVANKLGVNPGLIPMGGLLAMLAAGYFIFARRSGWAFLLTSLSIIFSVASVFLTLFPDVLVSNPNPANSLNIYNAASSPYTLNTMTMIALIFLPFVLGYQVWAYWVFRKRLTARVEDLHY
jgi:cytochrome d ubiquinol oxidase subunit II